MDTPKNNAEPLIGKVVVNGQQQPATPLFPVAVLVRPDGPYAVGQVVTVDPQAPWEKGSSPAFLDDEARMKEWRANGKPIFVDGKRFEAWKRDKFFEIKAAEEAAEKKVDKKDEVGQ